MAALSIPRTVDEIAPAWLTEALRSTGVLPGGQVTSVETERVGVGQGFVGNNWRLMITYDRGLADAPTSVVVKLPAADPVVRAGVLQRRAYEREIRFYEQNTAIPGVPAPRRYYGAFDSDSGDAILLLEDLGTAGIGDNINGCSLDDAMLAVETLAKFQARWWNPARLSGIPWMPSFGDSAAGVQAMYQQRYETFLQKFDDLVPSTMRGMITTLKAQVLYIFERVNADPQTICHFDYRLDNMAFRTPGGQPIAVFDWQTAVKGRGVTDAAYFILGYASADQRRATEIKLLRRYHDVLTASGVSGYSFQQCQEDYRFAMMLALVRRVTAGAVLDYTSERGRSYMNAMIQKTYAALVDHNVMDLLPG